MYSIYIYILICIYIYTSMCNYYNLQLDLLHDVEYVSSVVTSIVFGTEGISTGTVCPDSS